MGGPLGKLVWLFTKDLFIRFVGLGLRFRLYLEDHGT